MKYPLPATLAKYGLSQLDYRMFYEAQGGVCAVCKKPAKNTLYVDHEHVKGWKKLPPEKRKLYVRGLLCYFCNRYYLAKRMTVEKAHNIIEYMEAYALRQKRLIR